MAIDRYCGIVYILHINIERVADFTTQSSYKFKFYTLAANLQKTIEVLSQAIFKRRKIDCFFTDKNIISSMAVEIYFYFVT